MIFFIASLTRPRPRNKTPRCQIIASKKTVIENKTKSKSASQRLSQIWVQMGAKERKRLIKEGEEKEEEEEEDVERGRRAAAESGGVYTTTTTLQQHNLSHITTVTLSDRD